jgi:hypothetical protein
MSGDEALMLIVCGIIGLVGWGSWYFHAVAIRAMSADLLVRQSILLTPLLCAAILFFVLKQFASPDVRDSGIYLGFYEVMGAAWLTLMVRGSPLLGVSYWHDALERCNLAAAIALIGVLIGHTFCFAGANIGSGPGWWVVVYCATISSGSLFILWKIIDASTDTADSITIDRDEASALRLAGFLIAAGLILGRAVAGDWVSLAATYFDFSKLAWPGILIAAAAIVMQKLVAPTREHPRPSPLVYGALPAAILVLVSWIYVARIGKW